MLAILHLLGTSVANLCKSRRRLEVENLWQLPDEWNEAIFDGRFSLNDIFDTLPVLACE